MYIELRASLCKKLIRLCSSRLNFENAGSVYVVAIGSSNMYFRFFQLFYNVAVVIVVGIVEEVTIVRLHEV